ncbi:amidohydrolase 2 [Chthoniobacter flavus Ellin428]|uniref:Amidohydrolase 2 n=2 Tax=Chthoniobacter flavus TaxID=191863 RepID=B4CUH4_9BACT|nr:amidohydrolase 2 [Chthoniobacter flavus Ellin428]
MFCLSLPLPVPMKLDSHQHFWSYDARQYPWIAPGSPLQRDWLPPDLAPLLSAAGLEGCIAVQARQTIDESHWLLELAEHHSIIKGVVGWVDLRSPDVERDLAALAPHPKFCGVRHVVQDEPDVNFMLGEEFQRGIGKLRAFKLTYDILVYPRQLPAAITLAKRFPEQPFVLDHIAKPPIMDGTLSPWREQIRELAKAPNVLCKVSGMVTEADLAAWKPADFKPFLDVVFEAFGEDRVMYGSDWPVCLRAASYAQVHTLVDDYTRQMGATAREQFFGGNATKFYHAK